MKKEDRYIVGKQQLQYYISCQYPKWRYAYVKSIEKILNNLDDFYVDNIRELKQDYDLSGEITINKEIKNGLYFAALSETMQYIEDLFSLMLLSRDIEYFAKNVITYNATKIIQYIEKFNVDDVQYILQEYQIPYFDLDNKWEDFPDVFEDYKVAVLLIQDMFKLIKSFFMKYKLYYNQYKHGLSIGLNPFCTNANGNDKLDEATLMVFDNKQFQKRYRNKPIPALIIPNLTPEIAQNAIQLNEEENLLRTILSTISFAEIINVSKNTNILIQLLHNNLWNISENKNIKGLHKYQFPTKLLNETLTISFPYVGN